MSVQPGDLERDLWLYQELFPESPAYNVLRPHLLRGTLRTDAFTDCLDRLLKRHPVLHCTHHWTDGSLRRAGIDGIRLDAVFTTDDLRAAPDPLESGRDVALRLARRPFDLRREAPVRWRLLRLGESEWLFVIVIHHIAADASALEVLSRQFSAMYDGQVRGASDEGVGSGTAGSHAPGLPAGDGLAHWTQRLAGAAPHLDLPRLGRPAPDAARDASACAVRRLDDELVRRLQWLCGRHGATLFMVVLAGLACCLQRYTGQRDLVIGAPFANRGPDEADLVVSRSNLLPIRIRCADGSTFAELVRGVRAEVLAGLRHQATPLRAIAEALGVPGRPGRLPLLDVVFQVENLARQELRLPGVSSRLLHLDIAASPLELRVSLTRRIDGWWLEVDHAESTFSRAQAERFVAYLARSLDGVSRETGLAVRHLDLAGPEERSRRLARQRGTRTAYPTDRRLDELFDAVAARRAGAPAVTDHAGTLTYAELERLARDLARAIRASGTGPGATIAVLAGRSAPFVVGILAALKAGCTYVPIDPTYPGTRIDQMIADAGAELLLVEPAATARIRRDGPRWIALPSPARTVQDDPGPLGPLIGPAPPAYVMYTSGSTGEPKGVAVTHRAVARLVVDTDYVEIQPDDVVGQIASVSFDASTFEIWGALLNGAHLVIARVVSAEDVRKMIRRHRVTLLNLVTPLLHAIAEEDPGALSGIRTAVTGGDALSRELAARVLSASRCALVNGYGPTECATFSTAHRVDADGALAAPVPIGRPIANTNVYVLDREMAPVLADVTGEIYIGGDAPALGYVGRPGPTAERFLPDPFGAPGARMYRTGDIGRLDDAGTITFLGRRDRQVKIRGLRVEPREVEDAILQHPDVADVRVVAEGEGAARRLVAYCVGRPQAGLVSFEIRSMLSAVLPEHLVPAAYFVVSELPLTRSGAKVDEAALRASRSAGPGAGAAPAAPMERIVERAWMSTLDVEHVGRDDNFFEVGGYSLLVTTLVRNLERALGRPVPMSLVLAHPTVAGLAAALTAAP